VNTGARAIDYLGERFPAMKPVQAQISHLDRKYGVPSAFLDQAVASFDEALNDMPTLFEGTLRDATDCLLLEMRGRVVMGPGSALDFLTGRRTWQLSGGLGPRDCGADHVIADVHSRFRSWVDA